MSKVDASAVCYCGYPYDDGDCWCFNLNGTVEGDQ